MSDITPEPLPPQPTAWYWAQGSISDIIPIQMTTTVIGQVDRPYREVLPTWYPLLGDRGRAPNNGWVCVDIINLGGSTNYLMATMHDGRLFLRVDSSYNIETEDWTGAWVNPTTTTVVDLPTVARIDKTKRVMLEQAEDLGLIPCPYEMRDRILAPDGIYVYDPCWDVIFQADLAMFGVRLTVWFVQLDGYAIFIHTKGEPSVDYRDITFTGGQMLSAPPPWGDDLSLRAYRASPVKVEHVVTQTAYRRISTWGTPASIFAQEPLSDSAARQYVLDRFYMDRDPFVDSIIFQFGAYRLMCLIGESKPVGDPYNISEIYNYSVRYVSW